MQRNKRDEFLADVFLILVETDKETVSTLDLKYVKSYDDKGNIIYEFKF